MQTMEKLTQSVQSSNRTLLGFVKRCHDIDVPNGVDSAQAMLDQHANERSQLEQDLQRIKM